MAFESIEEINKNCNQAKIYLKYHKQLPSTNWTYFFLIFFGFLLIASILFYGIYTDKFKCVVSQQVTPLTQIKNNYTFNPHTNNNFDNDFNMDAEVNVGNLS